MAIRPHFHRTIFSLIALSAVFIALASTAPLPTAVASPKEVDREYVSFHSLSEVHKRALLRFAAQVGCRHGHP